MEMDGGHLSPWWTTATDDLILEDEVDEVDKVEPGGLCAAGAANTARSGNAFWRRAASQRPPARPGAAAATLFQPFSCRE